MKRVRKSWMEIRTSSKSHDNEFMDYIRVSKFSWVILIKNNISATNYYQMFRLIKNLKLETAMLIMAIFEQKRWNFWNIKSVLKKIFKTIWTNQSYGCKLEVNEAILGMSIFKKIMQLIYIDVFMQLISNGKLSKHHWKKEKKMSSEFL